MAKRKGDDRQWCVAVREDNPLGTWTTIHGPYNTRAEAAVDADWFRCVRNAHAEVAPMAKPDRVAAKGY